MSIRLDLRRKTPSISLKRLNRLVQSGLLMYASITYLSWPAFLNEMTWPTFARNLPDGVCACTHTCADTRHS